MITCNVCFIEKPESDYYVSNKHRCKSCLNAYAKGWQRKNSGLKNAYNKDWRDRNRERVKRMKDAGNAVWRALMKGTMVRPTECEECGTTEREIEAAHFDYSKPLMVRWLCVKCHRTWDTSEPKSSA